MKIRNALIAIAALTVAGSALALPPGEPPPPPPPPPPQLNDCSPGFWKNHEEYWAYGQFCTAEECVTDVMERLTAKGKGSGDTRYEMASILNAWADGYYGQICFD